ncbi:BRO family protein [Avibacterium paragallinarum]|uniref:BRO family protein n=1 Tax=Avibacterium paragallinarum TaxID=728 RepID=UPI0028688116|nr:BRO family protein [Avibacterium paragallinarum]
MTDIHQEPWFCANDVCAILEYANPRQAVQKNCNPKGVSIRDTLTKAVSKKWFISTNQTYTA